MLIHAPFGIFWGTFPQIMSLIVLTPKRTILGLNHVIWAINREFFLLIFEWALLFSLCHVVTVVFANRLKPLQTVLNVTFLIAIRKELPAVRKMHKYFDCQLRHTQTPSFLIKRLPIWWYWYYLSAHWLYGNVLISNITFCWFLLF